VISDADMIFTGEGKIDSQSLRGKVVIGVAGRAVKQNVPVIVVVGGADRGIDGAYASGVTAIFSINRMPEAFETSKLKSVEDMTFTIDNIMRLIKCVGT
ncbi:MAG: glycerate kinase, partial [Firmicutes bacterium]|nr:glycerate kinase [Bacillota bacterium]